MKSPFETETRAAFRETIRSFVEKEITPFAHEWDEAGAVPWALHEKLGALGIFGFGIEEQYGGLGFDCPFMRCIVGEEMAKCGFGGIAAAVGGRGISLDPIQRLAAPEIRNRVLKDIVLGKTGSSLISLFFVEKDAPGFSRTPLTKKMGWWASDQATLYFDDCRVPATNLMGQEDYGFVSIMNNFNNERLVLIAGCLGMMKAALEDSIAWAQQRETFGKPLIKHQVIRHKIADMSAKIDAVESYMTMICWNMEQGFPLRSFLRPNSLALKRSNLSHQRRCKLWAERDICAATVLSAFTAKSKSWPSVAALRRRRLRSAARVLRSC